MTDIYFGNVPNTASFISDQFSGNGSTTEFTLSAAPGSASALIVTIDGVKQHVAAYSVSGVTLTFTAAPPTGTNNIEVIHLGVRTEVGQPAAGTVGQAEIDTSSLNPIVQVAYNQDASVSSGATPLPSDDTIPQITEGDEFITQAITPKNASNLLVIEAVLQLENSITNNRLTVALFQDSTADALAVSSMQSTGGYNQHVKLKYYMVAGTTSSTTFRIRAGAASGTTYYNQTGGGRLFGGVAFSTLTITEIQQ